jgi:type IV pilus biogenesis/stability protein PilW
MMLLKSLVVISKAVNQKALLIFILISLTAFSCATTTKSPKVKPDDQATSIRNIGEAAIIQGNFTAAIKELLDAEKLNPKDPLTQNYLGIAYKNKQMTDLAISHFKKAIELKPDYSQAMNNLGTAYLDKEDWDNAITCFKDVVNDVLYLTPQYPIANLGWAYYKKKDYNAAEKYYRQALKVQPNLIVALNGLGQTYIETGKYAEAVDTFEKALQYGNQIPQLHFQLAKAYELENNYKKAITSYKKVIEIAPESEIAEDAKKRIEAIK